MIPLSRREVEKQSLILYLYEVFNLDDFGQLIYKNMQKIGVEGGKLKYAPNDRDVILTLYYEIDGKVEKDIAYLNVFDVFGDARHKKEIKKCLRDYYIMKFGVEYIRISTRYEIHKENNNITEYAPAEEMLLEPWWN